MTNLKSLMFPIIVWSLMVLLLGWLIANAMAIELPETPPPPPKQPESAKQTPIETARAAIDRTEAEWKDAASHDAKRKGVFEKAQHEKEEAFKAANDAFREATKDYGDGDQEPAAKAKHIAAVEAYHLLLVPKPVAPVRIEAEKPVAIEAPKPKTTIVIYVGQNCHFCRELEAAIRTHDMANYEVRYIEDNSGQSIPYADVTASGKQAMRVQGFPGWDSWIQSVRSCER